MTPQEKWERLHNPTTISDYGISIDREELQAIPEGREIVEFLDCKEKERRFSEDLWRSINIDMEAMGEAAARTMDNIFLSIIKNKRCSEIEQAHP